MGMDPVTMMAGASLASGLLGADAAGSAADAQVGASREATASQRAMFDKQTELEAPFRQFGVGASAKLSQLLGIGGGNGSMSYDQARSQLLPKYTTSVTGPGEWIDGGASSEGAGGGVYSPGATTSSIDENGLSSAIQQLLAQNPGSAGSDYGSLLKPFGMSDFQMDPGIQFQMDQGNQALTNSNAAKNGTLSGAALKSLIGFNQGMAGTGYQSAYDRYMQGKQFTLGSLMGATGVGQAAASNTANNGSSIANGIAGTITGGGNAAASGAIGTANALAGGIGGAGNAYYLSSLLGKGNADLGGPITGSANPGGVYIASNA